MKTRDLARDSVRDWLNDVMEKTGLSAGKLAKRAEISASTIYRALDPESVFVTSGATLSAISQKTGIPLPAGLLSGQAVYQTPGFSETELTELQHTPALPERGASNQGVWRIEGRSLELEGYLPGDVVIVDMGVTPTLGDIVCAQIYNFQRGTAETVLRLYDAPYLVGRSMDRSNQPKTVLVDNERVKIMGTVTRMIRDRHAA